MVKKILVAFLLCVASLTNVQGKTVAYWQLDNAADNLDAVNDDGNYFDLTMVGVVKNAASNTAFNPVPNPSKAKWRATAGDGLASANSFAQGFSGDLVYPDGWWRDPGLDAGDFEFTYQYNDDGSLPLTTHTASVDSAFMLNKDSSFTVECTFKATGTGFLIGTRGAIGYPLDYRGWQLWVTSAGKNVMLYADGCPTETGDPVQINYTTVTNQWYHVAAVWDHDAMDPNGLMSLYVDGQLVGSVQGGSTWEGISGGPLSIGVRKIWYYEDFPEFGFKWDYGMHGSIDEIRFVDEALTPEYFLNGTTPYTLCGEGIVVPGDLTGDCYVGLEDLEEFIADWLSCTDPGKSGCVEN